MSQRTLPHRLCVFHPPPPPLPSPLPRSQENNLEVSGWRERFFDSIKIKDPFEPIIPEELEITNYFTAPFKFERKEK